MHIKAAFLSVSIRIAIATCAILAALLPSLAYGQSLSPNPALNNLLSVDVTPKFPRAHDVVDISIQSFRADLNKADIAWFLNGSLASSGTGQRQFSFKLGANGTVSTVEIVIKPDAGEPYSQTLTIAPADVDLVWQANTYVPPFYKGKALAGYEAPVTVIAVPDFIRKDGTAIPASTLIYKWYKDTDTVYDTQSGYGRNTLELQNVTLGSSHVQVDVKSTDNTYFAHAEIDINPVSPRALLYQNSPLYGTLYNHAVGSLSLASNEITLAASPFYFAAQSPTDALTYAWFTNGAAVASQANRPSVTFRKQSADSGSANISVDVASTDKTLEQATARLNVTFTSAPAAAASF